MYSREFIPPPEHVIQNGKASFGSFTGVSPKIDIRGMRAPYAGVPLPSFISNLRIKSRLNYAFSLNKFIGMASFIDFKVIGLSEITLWNKETGKKYVYHSIMAPRRRFVPINTTRGICACYQRKRFLKISWGRQHQHHALTFKMKGDNFRPNVEGFVFSPMEDSMHNDVMFVCPSPASPRCSATWLNAMNVQGQITINGEMQDESTGLGIMSLTRAYYKFHSTQVFTYGIGVVKDKKVVLNLQCSNLDAADSDTYNTNILVVDGQVTALPPVYITHPFGTSKEWIIQDTENMVDLTFKPVSLSARALNLIALRTTYTNIYGTFDGVLLTKDGQKITLKSFPGILQNGMLRL